MKGKEESQKPVSGCVQSGILKEGHGADDNGTNCPEKDKTWVAGAQSRMGTISLQYAGALAIKIPHGIP